MTSRKQKRAILYDKLQLLRSVTNSTALNKTSIIVDASKYVEELKEKVEALDQEIGTNSHKSSSSSSSSGQNLPVEVGVEALEKGFLINVFSEKNCPGLLVSILEAFEDLGLDMLDARVSCADCFQLEAVGEENQTVWDMDAQVVKQAVLEAIKNWTAET